MTETRVHETGVRKCEIAKIFTSYLIFYSPYFELVMELQLYYVGLAVDAPDYAAMGIVE